MIALRVVQEVYKFDDITYNCNDVIKSPLRLLR